MRLSLGTQHSPTLTLMAQGVGAVFNPQILFTGGEQGYIYDNNDLGSFYTDLTVNQATVNGPVGFQLDKSKGLVAGANVRNQGAPALLGVATAATYDISTGAGSCTRVDASNQSGVRFSGLTPDSWYRVNITVTTGSILTRLSLSAASFGVVTAPATADVFALTTATGTFDLACTGAGTSTFTVNSVQSLFGNHRYQVIAASRPTLRGTPTGANQFVNGDFATGTLTGWTNPDSGGGATTVVGNKALMNNNTTGTARLRQSITVTVGQYKRVRFTVSGLSGTGTSTISFGSTGTGDSAYASISMTANGTFERWIGPMTTTTLGIAAIVPAAAGVVSLELDDFDCRDVSSGSVTAPYGFQYDGVDDFLQTASVNFTATDSMNVCMGARKLSDAANGTLVELSTNAGTSNGAFAIYAPVTAAANISAASRGTAVSTPVYSNAAIAAPVTFVPTLVADISADTAVIRVNGVQVASAATDQGTGNYGNYVLYFGRRAGTGNAFNGLEFGGVCINRTLSSADLTSVERWVGVRTGVTI